MSSLQSMSCHRHSDGCAHTICMRGSSVTAYIRSLSSLHSSRCRFRQLSFSKFSCHHCSKGSVVQTCTCLMAHYLLQRHMYESCESDRLTGTWRSKQQDRACLSAGCLICQLCHKVRHHLGYTCKASRCAWLNKGHQQLPCTHSV